MITASWLDFYAGEKGSSFCKSVRHMAYDWVACGSEAIVKAFKTRKWHVGERQREVGLAVKETGLTQGVGHR